MPALTISTPFALIGAGIGAGATVTAGLLLGAAAPALGITAGVVSGLVIIAYIVASFTVGSNFGEVVRGLMIGINAGLNFVLVKLLLTAALGTGAASAALGIAIGLGVANLLAVVGPISQNGVYQFVIGYLNWFLPMSWLVVALGVVFFLLNALGALCIGLPGADFFKITELAFDWKTGTIFTKGGWISNLNPIDTAYNMGNFAFVDKLHTGMKIDHEAGHTLNLAAFGSVFHLVGAIDENVIRNGANAFSERLADSNDPNASESPLPMWN
ncbi:MAG TPA: hypothetical protein VHX44_03120 [Planctomycetota bacterium]|nr:hypothetical protein [Planctomycetota bacterium]